MQNQHHFAARLIAVVRQSRLNIADRAAQKGFKRFRQLARQRQPPLREHGRHIGQSRPDTVRRFKHHHRIVRFRPLLEQLAPLARFRRQETVEIKIRLGHTRPAQSRHHRTRANHGHDIEPRPAHPRRQPRARVAHRRRTRIRHLRHNQAV